MISGEAMLRTEFLFASLYIRQHTTRHHSKETKTHVTADRRKEDFPAFRSCAGR
jgi:hypothetical protein